MVRSGRPTCGIPRNAHGPFGLPGAPLACSTGVDPSTLPGARRAPFPADLKPMLATLTDRPFSSDEWTFEPKLDGVRTLAFVRDGRARLVSRRGSDQTGEFPGVAAELAERHRGALALDGEVVA